MRALPSGRWLLVLLLGAVLLRLGYGLARPPSSPEALDPDHYLAIAASFSETGSLLYEGQPTAMREPVYPVLMGTLFKAFGRGYGVVLLANAFLGALALYWLFLVGRDLFGERTAFLAAAAAAAYPPFVFYASQGVRETAMLAVSALAVWALVRALRGPGDKAFAAAGAAQALCGLTNTVLLPFGAVLSPALILFLCREKGLAALRWAAVFFACFAVLYSPWPVRNQLVFHRFIPGTTVGPSTILYVYLVVPQELGGTEQEVAILAADPTYQALGRLEPSQRDAAFMKASLDRIRSHPWSFARLVSWRFFWDQWRIAPRPRTDPGTYRLQWWASVLSNGWIIPLGLLGMALARGRPREALCVYAFVFSLCSVYSLILTMHRYRLPIMPWMILFACFALDRAWEKWRRDPASSAA